MNGWWVVAGEGRVPHLGEHHKPRRPRAENPIPKLEPEITLVAILSV